MWLSIDESFFSTPHRYQTMAILSGLSEGDAIWHLERIWFTGLKMERDVASFLEVCAWGGVVDNPKTYVAALCNEIAHYLEEMPDGRYKIIGLRKYIDIKISHRSRGQKGGRGKAEAAKKRKGVSASSRAQPDLGSSSALAGSCHIEIETEIETEIENIEIKDARSDSPPAQTISKINSDLKLGEPAPKKKPKRKTSTQKPKITTWEPDNLWAVAFHTLNTWERYRAIFDVPTDASKLDRYVNDFGLTKQEVEFELIKFVDYWQGQPVKSPRGKLATWMGNCRTTKLERDAKQMPMSAKEKKIRLDEIVDKRARDALTQEQRDNPFESAYKQRRNKPF